MSSYQAGLCLSCGAPFSPSLDDVDFFSQRGNRCVLFLHREFRANLTLQRTYVSDTLKFTGKPHNSHIFHDAHHIRAIRFMAQHHAHDAALTWPVTVPPSPREILPNAQNGPIAFYLHPKGEARGPGVAVWARPLAHSRLDFRPLLTYIRAVAIRHPNRNRLFAGQNLDQTYSICEGCNALMTQEANMRYHLGITNTANQNSRGCIIPPRSIRVRPAEPGAFHIDNAYGNWTFDMTTPPVYHPNLTASDALTPHVAYYLHMCLPFFAGVHHFRLPGSDRAARNLYLELSWVVLEIACLVTLLEEGRRYGGGKPSHGPHQNLGVLDFYVSYFLWRLLEFEFTERINRSGLDFVQWHQKYYWEAIHCSALFPRNTGTSGIIGYLAYGNPQQPSRLLLQDICARLMRVYTGDLRGLILFVTGHIGLPPEIQDYFLPLQAMRELRNRSHHRVRPSRSDHLKIPRFHSRHFSFNS